MTLNEFETLFCQCWHRLPQLRSPDFTALRAQVEGDPEIKLMVARTADGAPARELPALGVPFEAVRECYRYRVIIPGRDGWPIDFLVDLFVGLLPKKVRIEPDLDDLDCGNAERQARHAAQRYGLKVKRSRQPRSHHQRGGLMLVDPVANTIIAGAWFELSPRDVITLCTDRQRSPLI